MKSSLQAALDQQGYETLTPVQTAVTDPEIGERDLLVSAQTGSGKTVGFGLAIAPTLLGDAETLDRAGKPLALIIAPTRELALQVRRELTWLYSKAGAVITSCVGGMDMRDERRALERGAHIVVATPGRLRDHIMRKSIDLSFVRAVVLDEADEMLDLGFQEDLEFILAEAPSERRTLLFSATVPRGIASLAKSYQRDALRIETAAEKQQHADIDYVAMPVGPRDVENAIINVLRFYEAPNALVFANTRATVNRLTARLSNRGFQVVALSGELSQTERTHALQAMRDGRARVCVATDVAARGIDLPNLDLVVHAEIPGSHETLLHRSGRTGRAGRKGTSVMIVPPASRKKIQRVLGMAKLTARWGDAPSAEDVNARDFDRMMADPVWSDEIAESEIEKVAALVENFSPEQIAAAYLAMYKTHHSPPEELSPVNANDRGKPEPRAPFGPSTWFSLEGGRKAGAEPRRVMPMLCKAGGLTKDDFGAIRVQFNETFVEIRQESVAAFVAKIGPAMTVEEGAKLTQLHKAPELGPARGPGGGGKPDRGPKRDYGEKPARPKRDDKPRGEKAGYDKPKYDKPRTDKPKFDKPKQDKTKYEKPAAAEAPKPKQRPDMSDPSKSARKPGSKAAPKRKNTGATDWNDAPPPRHKKPKPGPGKAAGKLKGSPSKGKPGGAPAVGKPNSKKNKARRAGLHPAPGGDAPPKRRS